MTRREFMLAWGSLWLLGTLVFLPYLLHGGLFSDDWAQAAGTLHPPHGSGLLGALATENSALSSCRPISILFIPLKHLLFGTNAAALVTLSICLALLVASLLYAVLRTLKVPWYHAWLIAALTIAYPWFDSTRFWEAANPLSLSLAFALAGLWSALVGLSRRSWPLHLGAVLLYLLSMLTYEITLPLIAVAGLLYTIRDGWRAARWRWAADLVAVAVAGLWDRAHTPRAAVTTLSGYIDQTRAIAERGAEVLARTLWPVGRGVHTSAMLWILAATFAAVLCAYPLIRGRRDGKPSSWGVHSWLLLATAGLLVAVLGWALLIPASYAPNILGTENRVNGLAGIGLLLIVYAAFGVVGSAVGGLAGRRARLATGTTLILALVLGGGYLHVLERHSRAWRSAYSMELAAVDRMRTTFPTLPHGTTLFAANYPATTSIGVPVFANTWDLNGLVTLIYSDNTLRAYPITEELELHCRIDGVVVKAGESATMPAAYGTARLIDLQSGQSSRPRNQRQCMSEKSHYPPGPLHLSLSY